MAHLDYKDDADNIANTLVDLGFSEMATTWKELQLLFDVSAEKFKEVEQKAIADGVIDRFCNNSKPILVEKFGEFQFIPKHPPLQRIVRVLE